MGKPAATIVTISFSHAFLEELGGGKLRPEEQRVLSECHKRGLATTLYTTKRIQRRQLALNQTAFICGDMDAMYGAMKQLGIAVPKPLDYPDCLMPFAHRRVWSSTLAQLEHHVDQGNHPVFAKPAVRQKVFTGRVFSSPADFYAVGHVGRQEAVWCSEVVQWRSEFRVYVLEHRVVAVDHYGGDAGVAVDLGVVERAVRTFHEAGVAPAGYAIDFGVLATGETALVEVNDGFALGAYQIDAATYTDLLFARWRELLQSAYQN